MAKLIVKCGYMKKNNKQKGGFLNYIAKRDGVIKDLKIISSRPATPKQKEFIEEYGEKYKHYQEYESYLANKTVATASEFITKIEESMIQIQQYADIYLKYIAERPRVVKELSHGLFSFEDNINLTKAIDEVQKHEGVVWTAIVSLKREDATRLGYDDLDNWKTLLRVNQNELSKILGISEDTFKWYAAFHDEAHHPHIHLVMYSTDIKQGYLSKSGIDKIRSKLATQIFKQDLIQVYDGQTQTRTQLKDLSKSKFDEIVDSINFTENKAIDLMIIELSNRLKNCSGKKQYGYLSNGIKNLVDDIVVELSLDPSIKEMLDKWYEYKQEINNVYSNKEIERLRLSELKEFKSIKNYIIKVALELEDRPIVKSAPTITMDEKEDIEIIQKHVDVEALIYKAESESAMEIIDFKPSLKLMHHLSNMIKNSVDHQHMSQQVDRKLQREINMKKMKQGIKLGGIS